MPLKDLPGYYPEVLDGGLGVMPPSLAGLFGVVGVSQKGETDIRFAANADDVVDAYGLGSMTERISDAFASGAWQIGIRRALPTTDGSISAITHKVYGDPDTGGNATTDKGMHTGVTNPYNSRKFRIRIIKGGDISSATYKLSRNDGISWGPETKFTATASGVSKIDIGNGTYIEFTEGSPAEDSFVAGDEYRWSTTEARASTAALEEAIEDILDWADPNTGQGVEYLYVAALPPVTQNKTNIKAFWTSICTKAETLWTQEARPVWVIVDVPSLEDADGCETIDEWITLLNSVSAEYRHVRLCVNAGFALLTGAAGCAYGSMISGTAQPSVASQPQVRPVGGSLAGLAAGAKLHHSVGWVRYMNIPNAVTIYPNHPPATATETGLGGSQTGNLSNYPVIPWTVDFTADGSHITDGGDGKLWDSGGTEVGTIDYATGAYDLGSTPTTCEVTYSYDPKDVMNKVRISLLNDGRFTTLRLWTGYGIRFTDDWLMAPPTSDYFCIRNRRIVDEAVRMVGIANVPYINSPGITEKDMAAYKADLSRPLEAMKITEENTDKPIMDYRLVLTPDENIWSNGIVHAKIEIIPTPTKKKLEATFQLRTKLEE
ncbi:hypothetical protein GF359_05020 [candidate division WOR-3 bacterium]|uniref:Uncharacterized protein n=1 Tax=candidate division WOR-3 bacterium TaxID=2052148 RepID=A0A9D5QCZ1_UNCW3|nr:hypothetical protein [candidate division WOR-3 bacterium]MBD3364557.1 hypothetical protein [candidate division WOR-3 bacterium]